MMIIYCLFFFQFILNLPTFSSLLYKKLRFTGCKIKFPLIMYLNPAGVYSHFLEDPLFCVIEVNWINLETIINELPFKHYWVFWMALCVCVEVHFCHLSDFLCSSWPALLLLLLDFKIVLELLLLIFKQLCYTSNVLFSLKDYAMPKSFNNWLV